MTKAGGFFTAMAAAAVLVAAIPSAAPAASSNDGNWSVTIITQAGNCPSSLRYGVRVAVAACSPMVKATRSTAPWRRTVQPA